MAMAVVGEVLDDDVTTVISPATADKDTAIMAEANRVFIVILLVD